MTQWDRLFPGRPIVRRDMARTDFKSNLISLYFVRPLTARQAALGALLSRVLSFASAEYPSLRAISHQEDDLYGAVVYFDMDKYRDQLVLEYKLIYPRYDLLPVEMDYSDQVVAFYCSLLFRPLWRDGLFDQAIFETEKKNLLEDLESLRTDPPAYAYRRCNEIHFAGSALGIYKYGDIASVEQLTNQDLVAFYHELLASPVYLYRHGNFTARQPVLPAVPADEERLALKRRIETIEEERDIHQTILVQAYQTDIEHSDAESQAAMLFCHLLGGDANSLLFRTIREQHAYCYDISTKYDKYRNVMFLSTAFDRPDQTRLEGEIERLVGLMQTGDFSEEDLAAAKLETIQGLRSLNDRQTTLLDYQFVQDLFGQPLSIEQRVELIEQLTCQDVARAARRFELATSFCLKGMR